MDDIFNPPGAGLGDCQSLYDFMSPNGDGGSSYTSCVANYYSSPAGQANRAQYVMQDYIYAGMSIVLIALLLLVADRFMKKVIRK